MTVNSSYGSCNSQLPLWSWACEQQFCLSRCVFRNVTAMFSGRFLNSIFTFFLGLQHIFEELLVRNGFLLTVQGNSVIMYCMLLNFHLIKNMVDERMNE
jgi:hypothetical protein